jgi:small subunit ribosomal protein S21
MKRNNYNQKNDGVVSLPGLAVEVRNNDINGALRRFKKKVQEDGVLQHLKERQYYEKPSETRKKAKAAGRKRWLKKLAKLNER